MRVALVVCVSLSAAACVTAPAPPPYPATHARPQAERPAALGVDDAADCPRSACPRRAMGMPNWECADGRRGGPACKRTPDGACGWVVVECEGAERPPPPAEPIVPRRSPPVARRGQQGARDHGRQRPEGCGQLPSEAALLRWPVQTYGGCSGGRPNPRAQRPTPPKVVRELRDGTKIIELGEQGCVRAVEAPCRSK